MEEVYYGVPQQAATKMVGAIVGGGGGGDGVDKYIFKK